MDYDTNKVDDAALALMYLTSFVDNFGSERTWKGLDWDIMDRLFEKDFISDPKSKAKSVAFTPEGKAKSEALFKQLFGQGEAPEQDAD